MAAAVEASKLDLIQLVFPSELVFHRGMWCEDNRKLKCLLMDRNRGCLCGQREGRLVKLNKIQRPHRMRHLCIPIYSHFCKMNSL